LEKGNLDVSSHHPDELFSQQIYREIGMMADIISESYVAAYNSLYMKPILENEEQRARQRSERKQRLAHYCSCVITSQLGNAADRIVTPATALKASNGLTINLRQRILRRSLRRLRLAMMLFIIERTRSV